MYPVFIICQFDIRRRKVERGGGTGFCMCCTYRYKVDHEGISLLILLLLLVRILAGEIRSCEKWSLEMLEPMMQVDCLAE